MQPPFNTFLTDVDFCSTLQQHNCSELEGNCSDTVALQTDVLVFVHEYRSFVAVPTLATRVSALCILTICTLSQTN